MAMYEEFAPQPNRLLNAQSAYLRHAAYQPVGWYEFGPEAFAEAARQRKPILLDIGAAWCHWCHVIDRESYENPQIATIINERFIPIKVDRDERPDVDARYQAAVQALTGHGGWPLTVFLNPDGEPFYGGTYFPPEDHGDYVGMKTMLSRVAEAYAHHAGELEQVATTLTERGADTATRQADPAPLHDAIPQQIARGIKTMFNAATGGFERSAPKFPHPGAIEFALLYADATGDAAWTRIVTTTLTAMGRGGINDQLAGGFHRYATDERWIVPHFEKMSFDNALLLENYVHAFRATGDEQYREVANGILTYILHTLTDHQRGGFFGTQDADVGLEDDGDYWTWSEAEVRELLTPEDYPVIARHFGITSKGDMPHNHRNVLHVAATAEEIALALQRPVEEVREQIARGKARLLEVRNKRKAPAVDTHKYANWNALLISALLEAGTLLERTDAVRVALRAAHALHADAYEPDHGIYHAFHGEHGARLPGFFEDQAYAARAFIAAYMSSADATYLDVAAHLMELAIAQYWDQDNGGFMDLSRERLAAGEAVPLRHQHKTIEDMPTPSANAIAAMTLDQLWLLTHNHRYREYAGKTLETFATRAPEYGPFAAYYGLAVHYHLHPPATAIIVGAPNAADTHALHAAALATYRPGRLVAILPPDSESISYPAHEHGHALAYICAGEACAPPTADPETMRTLLTEFGRK